MEIKMEIKIEIKMEIEIRNSYRFLEHRQTEKLFKFCFNKQLASRSAFRKALKST